MVEQNAFTILFGIFLLFTFRDVFYGSGGSGHAAEPELNAPPDHLSSHSSHHHNHHAAPVAGLDPTISQAGLSGLASSPLIKVQYCQSCGYRQAFDDLSMRFQSLYPGIRVEGEIHQPGWLRSQVVNLLFVVKTATLAMLYIDINPFTYFQMETPRIWEYMRGSKISSSLIILSLANIVETSMVSTGAFEIFYNDIPIWSKIQTGRMPSAPELHQIVQSQMSMGGFETSRGKFTPM